MINMKSISKMLCLVDGEHYLPVTQESIDVLNNLEHIDIVAAVFIGGTEKLRDDSEESYSKVLGVPVQFAKNEDIPYDLIVEMINRYDVDTVMDLSDEPILDYPKRFKIACKTLAQGAGLIWKAFLAVCKYLLVIRLCHVQHLTSYPPYYQALSRRMKRRFARRLRAS